MNRSAITLLLVSLALALPQRWSTAAEFDIDEAVANAIEYDDWQTIVENIEEVTDNNEIPVMIDAIRTRFGKECSPMLVEKIIGDFYNAMGMIFYDLENFAEAEKYFTAACSLCVKYDYPDGIRANLINQGAALAGLGNKDLSVQKFAEAMASAVAEGRIFDNDRHLNRITDLILSLDEISPVLNRAVSIYEPLKDSGILQTGTIHFLGAVWFSERDSLERAAAEFNLAADLFNRAGYGAGKMYCMFALAEACRRMGMSADSLDMAYGNTLIAAVSSDSLDYVKNIMEAWREAVTEGGAGENFESTFVRTIEVLSGNEAQKDRIFALTDFVAVVNETCEWDPDNTIEFLNRSLEFWKKQKDAEKQVDLLLVLAQKQQAFGDSEKAVSNYTNALRLCLSGRRWIEAQSVFTAITETELYDQVRSAVKTGLNGTEQAMFYVLETRYNLQWDDLGSNEVVLSDSLERALKVFEKGNDKTGMAITEQLLGQVKWYFNRFEEGEKYYWDAVRHAVEMNDSSFTIEAISSAAGRSWAPAGRVDDFDTFLHQHLGDGPFTSRYRISAADKYREVAGDFYASARQVFEACAETLVLLDDAREEQLALRAATLEFYTDLGSGDFSFDTLRSYRPDVPIDHLKWMTFSGADSLRTYINDLSSSCTARGTDRWILNFMEILRGYINLGCGNLLRSLSDHEYRLASHELKKEWDALDLTGSRLRALDIILLRSHTCASRFYTDSILLIYDEFQKTLGGKTYRGLPYESREWLGEIVAAAMKYEHKGNESLLKQDLLGFADRMVDLGSSYGLGAGMAEFPEEGWGGDLKFNEGEPIEGLIMPVRFDYIDACPIDWNSRRLSDIENAVVNWEQNLYWDTGERDHWGLIDILLKIELGDYRAADSLMRNLTVEGSVSKWVKAFGKCLRGELGDMLGRFREARDSYALSDHLAGELIDNSYMRACITGNSGNLWLRLGDDDKAEAAFDSIIDLAGEDPALKLLMARAYISRTNLRLIRALRDRDTAGDMAVNAYSCALGMLADISEPNTMLAAKVNLAAAYAVKGDINAADSVLNEVIEYTQGGWFPVELGGALLLRGHLLGMSGKYESALDCCSTAAAVYRQIGAQYALSSAMAMLGKISRRIGDNENALKYLKGSVDIFEAIRAQTDALDISTTFSEANTDRYGELIDLLVTMGRPKEAFSYAERSKAKSLKDAVDIGKIETKNAQLSQALRKNRELEAVSAQYESELMEERSKRSDLVDSAKIAQLTKILAKTKSEFIKCGGDVIKLDPDYAALIKVTPGQLAKLQPQMTAGTLFLEYYAAPESVFIFEVGRKDFKVRTVYVTRDSLYALIRKFRALISEAAASIQGGAGIDPVTSWDGPGEEIISLKTVLSALYDALITPVADDMTNTDNIVIIPSGLLSYLPFHALAHDTKDGYKFFVEEKNVSYLTALELLDIAKNNLTETKPNSLLGFANPDGSLPSAMKEVEAIKAVFPKSDVFTLDQATEDNASRLSADYNVLHFATHAVIDEKIPDESYVLLAKGAEGDGRWSMSEVYGLTWEKTSLVVLSACETALGEKDPGREVATLASAFSTAGTPSVIASLWSVYDPSTQRLMETFYQEFKRESKASSLKSAQISLLHDPKYAHPFYWAPFILIGDWR